MAILLGQLHMEFAKIEIWVCMYVYKPRFILAFKWYSFSIIAWVDHWNSLHLNVTDRRLFIVIENSQIYYMEWTSKCCNVKWSTNEKLHFLTSFQSWKSLRLEFKFRYINFFIHKYLFVSHVFYFIIEIGNHSCIKTNQKFVIYDWKKMPCKFRELINKLQTTMSGSTEIRFILAFYNFNYPLYYFSWL